MRFSYGNLHILSVLCVGPHIYLEDLRDILGRSVANLRLIPFAAAFKNAGVVLDCERHGQSVFSLPCRKRTVSPSFLPHLLPRGQD